MKQVQHHQHLRKRKSGKAAHPYPHPDPRIRFLDNVALAVAIIMPLTTIPQLYNIWILRLTEGVSALTWGLWAILCVPMLIYGIVHRVKPLIVTYIMWIIIEIIVVIGVLLY